MGSSGSVVVLILSLAGHLQERQELSGSHRDRMLGKSWGLRPRFQSLPHLARRHGNQSDPWESFLRTWKDNGVRNVFCLVVESQGKIHFKIRYFFFSKRQEAGSGSCSCWFSNTVRSGLVSVMLMAFSSQSHGALWASDPHPGKGAWGNAIGLCLFYQEGPPKGIGVCSPVSTLSPGHHL